MNSNIEQNIRNFNNVLIIRNSNNQLFSIIFTFGFICLSIIIFVDFIIF
jgi:hypothetical protein